MPNIIIILKLTKFQNKLKRNKIHFQPKVTIDRIVNKCYSRIQLKYTCINNKDDCKI